MTSPAIALPVERPPDDWVAEATYFTLDVFDHEDTGRLVIDPFDFRRYVALGWIRYSAYRPGYELTTNGEDVYRKLYWDVAKQAGWDWRYEEDDE